MCLQHAAKNADDLRISHFTSPWMKKKKKPNLNKKTWWISLTLKEREKNSTHRWSRELDFGVCKLLRICLVVAGWLSWYVELETSQKFWTVMLHWQSCLPPTSANKTQTVAPYLVFCLWFDFQEDSARNLEIGQSTSKFDNAFRNTTCQETYFKLSKGNPSNQLSDFPTTYMRIMWLTYYISSIARWSIIQIYTDLSYLIIVANYWIRLILC